MHRILVVEDEAAIARVLVDNLIFEGHEAEAVADGAEGWSGPWLGSRI